MRPLADAENLLREMAGRRRDAFATIPTAHPLEASGEVRGRPARVCIATSDLIGPVKNGGVGTACTALAETLAAAGHDVTVLFAGPFEAGSAATWREEYARRGVTFAVPDEPGFPLEGPEHARASFLAFSWLEDQPAFDIVHFPEINGLGFYALTAKRLGLAFGATTLVVTLHSPTVWHRLENREPVFHSEDLVLDFMERECVARADVLISPTRYLLQWAVEWGFQLPTRVHVQPNLRRGSAPLPANAGGRARELVFFGRLETRKGLELFCDALERLVRAGQLPGVGVTFLGKNGRVGTEDGVSFVRRRMAAMSLDVRIESAHGQADALEYLRRTQGLAVMPSLADNLPYTVLECISEGIPFVSTTVGGIPECIHPDDRSDVLSEPTAIDLASLLRRRLSGSLGAARPATDEDLNRHQWLDWHDRERQVEPAPARHSDPPLVSVCIATRNRPLHLRAALASLLKQSYPRLEIVIVDDASDAGDARALLDTLASEFGPRGWHIIRSSTQRGPGGARNIAAAHATGEFLLFMDDDNIARADEVETFVRAAAHSGVPLLTCVVDHFADGSEHAPEFVPSRRWLPLGPALVPGLFGNQFGDTNFFIARETFLAMGGFDEDAAAQFVEDWVFLSRAVLRGVEMAVVPRPLLWYRNWPAAHGQGRPPSQSLFRRLQPYLYSERPDRRGLTLLAAAAQGRLESQAAAAHLDRARAAMLERRFTSANRWWHLGPGDAGLLRAERDLSISPATDGVRLESLGRDPIAWLACTAPAGVHSIVRIDVTVPRDSCLQLFWSTRERPFPCEEQSVLVPVPCGRHVVWAEIPAAHHVGTLRFDPSFEPGVSVLHSMELRAEGKPRVGSVVPGSPRLRFFIERLRRAVALPFSRSG